MPLFVHPLFACELRVFAQASENLTDWIRMIRELSPAVLIAIFGAFVLGVIFTLLLRKGRKRKSDRDFPAIEQGSGGTSGSGVAIPAELEWRHEKLILADRQMQEGHQRLAKFTDWLGANRGSSFSHSAGALFFLEETIREERHRVGSEISKVNLMIDRLGSFEDRVAPSVGKNGEHWKIELAECQETLSEQVGYLKARQVELRSILKAVVDLGEKFFCDDKERSLDPGETEGRLSRVIESLSRLQSGLHDAVSDSIKRVSDLLDSFGGRIPERDCAEMSGFLDVIAVDGQLKTKLGKAGLVEAGEKALEAFRHRQKPGADAAKRSAVPDTGFRAPIFFEDPESSHEVELPSENVFTEDKLDQGEETAPIFTADKTPEPAESSLPDDYRQIIFCSNNPELWNQNVYKGARSRSKALSELPEGIEWVGIKRLDTGEQVFCRCGTGDLNKSGDGFANGFNGSNELFYEARHLGMFSESCEGEVETRFTYGGWGFGHRVTGFDEDPGPPQASGWAGQLISSDTVFEISVYKKLPETSENDHVLPVDGMQAAEVVR